MNTTVAVSKENHKILGPQISISIGWILLNFDRSPFVSLTHDDYLAGNVAFNELYASSELIDPQRLASTAFSAPRISDRYLSSTKTSYYVLALTLFNAMTKKLVYYLKLFKY